MGLYGKSPHLHFISGSIFLQNLVLAAFTTFLLLQKGRVVEGFARKISIL
ncbi:hypothetical protein HMPREF9296_1968 [Prevotella disiens FB035-09AN]|uniref:Uncharacterized protein n=1 Tax=Prevotella disiens FB035-09AN TaxID=866771 RepID=E1KNB3_9BACT|nr:hypothetical protein HMPREF9296_1968 [Prevotella disiens FB035-09AN]